MNRNSPKCPTTADLTLPTHQGCGNPRVAQMHPLGRECTLSKANFLTPTTGDRP